MLRDDWLAINAAASEDGDPVISCIFKTEFITQLQQLTNGGVTVLVGPTVEYAKKKDKKANIKFIKDESIQRNDVYKSHEVHVPSGENPERGSNPPVKGKARPPTQKSNKPAVGARAAAKPRSIAKPQPTAQALPNGNMPAPPPAPPALGGPTNATRTTRIPAAPQIPAIIPLRASAAPTATATRAPPKPPAHKAAPPPPPAVSSDSPSEIFLQSLVLTWDFRHLLDRNGKSYTILRPLKLVRWPW